MQISIRRCLATASLLFVSAFLPLLFCAVYYSLRVHSDIDGVITAFRTGAPPGDPLRWSIRVGSASFFRSANGWHSTSRGLTVRSPEAEQHHAQVTAGHLNGTYQTTYLAGVEGSAIPVVITAFRDNGVDGHVAYGARIEGAGPIWSYVAYAAGFSVLGAIFLELTVTWRRTRMKSVSNSATTAARTP